MKKNRKKIILIIIFIVIFIVGFVSIMIYLNNSQNNYTFLEKKWIDNNENNIIDIYVEDDLPIFSLSGSGVFYDFVKDLELDTGLSFNISYTSASPMVMSTKSKKTNEDVIFFKDHFVLVSKTNVYLSDLTAAGAITVGVLNDELSNISSNLTKYSNIEYKTYDSMEELEEAFSKDTISYMIISLYENLDLFMNNNYNVIYHFDGLNKYFTVGFNNASKELISIINKFYNKWETRKEEKFSKYFTDLFYDINKYTEIEKESVTNDDFIVGYIENMPLEGKINNTFSGLTGHYLKEFSKLTGTTYKYIKYKNVDKLLKALSDKKIDLVYNSYGINNSNYVTTGYIGTKNIVVLVPNNSDLIINSIESLKGMDVSLIKNRSLKNMFSTQNIFNIVERESVEELYKTDNDVIIIEKEVYDYYKTNKLEDYKIAYIGNEYVYDAFLLNNSNEALNKLFSFYISIKSAKTSANQSVIDTLQDKNNNWFLSFIVDNAFVIIIILLLALFIGYKYGNKVRLTKKIKKEDKMLYLDVMTNVKNRNYLNDNIEYWEKNIIYPQTIIILDLNKIKELNDKQGHEAGDEQIKACANVLIKTQRENSEIMRTDGNEFTIYLVGYEEKVIMSYIHKLNKELKNSLPNKEYGVSIGYSMITNEIKTIDDAINEALIMVKENKGISNEGN